MKHLICYTLLLFSLAVKAQSESATENIFIITTDGFRWQEVFTGADEQLINDPLYVQDTALLKEMFWDHSAEIRRQKLMPFLWGTVARNGQLYGNRLFHNYVNVSNIYKISYPGYNEMFTGYPDPVFVPNIPLSNPNLNIFEWLNNKTDYHGKIAVFSSWNIFSAIINKKRNHLPINAGYEPVPDDSSDNNRIINASQELVSPKKNTRYDLLTFLTAREYIEHNHPRVVLIGFGETDEFAHNGRYDLYLQQAANVDRMIADLWYFVQSNSFYRNKTTFLITTDHGRGSKTPSWFKHGIFTKGSGETWFALIGPDVSPVGEIRTHRQVFQKQIASTIGYLLNTPFDQPGNKAPPINIPMKSEFNTALTRELPSF
jgi:hypothetical protein